MELTIVLLHLCSV